MVHPGGKSTMLGHWRMVLRQAEELAQLGRFEEALGLASRADVADHRQAVQLRGRLALDLVSRAVRRGQADDLAGAMDDLDLAERFGVAPDVLAAARLSLADRVAAEVRADLEAGEIAKVLERVDMLARRKVGGPALRRAREAAEAWQGALDEGRRGEFARALGQLDRAERLAGEPARLAIDATRRDLEARQEAAHLKVDRLYESLGAGRWAETLAAAEAVLAIVPEHAAARQARARAWQQIAAIHPSASLPHRNGRISWNTPMDADAPIGIPSPRFVGGSPAPREQPGVRPPIAAPIGLARVGPSGPRGRFLLWADSIGGYLICLDDEVVLGRAGPGGVADVPLLGDVSRHHATLVRDGDGYILRADHPSFVNGRAVDAARPLRDGDVIRLGSTLELEFRQPSPVSSTARLTIVSRHRLPLAVEGVILMAETCIMGPSSQAHVPAPGLADPVVLYRQGPALWCRAAGPFEVDGRPCLARAPLSLQSSVLGDGFSFSLEPLGDRSSPV